MISTWPLLMGFLPRNWNCYSKIGYPVVATGISVKGSLFLHISCFIFCWKWSTLANCGCVVRVTAARCELCVGVLNLASSGLWEGASQLWSGCGGRWAPSEHQINGNWTCFFLWAVSRKETHASAQTQRECGAVVQEVESPAPFS